MASTSSSPQSNDPSPQRKYRSENNVHALFAQLDALMTQHDAGAHNPYNLPEPVYRGTTPSDRGDGGDAMRRGGGGGARRGGEGGAAAAARSTNRTARPLDEMTNLGLGAGRGGLGIGTPTSGGGGDATSFGFGGVRPNSRSDAKSAFFASMRKQQSERSTNVVGGTGLTHASGLPVGGGGNVGRTQRASSETSLPVSTSHNTSLVDDDDANTNSPSSHYSAGRPLPQSAPEKYMTARQRQIAQQLQLKEGGGAGAEIASSTPSQRGKLTPPPPSSSSRQGGSSYLTTDDVDNVVMIGTPSLSMPGTTSSMGAATLRKHQQHQHAPPALGPLSSAGITSAQQQQYYAASHPHHHNEGSIMTNSSSGIRSTAVNSAAESWRLKTGAGVLNNNNDNTSSPLLGGSSSNTNNKGNAVVGFGRSPGKTHSIGSEGGGGLVDVNDCQSLAVNGGVSAPPSMAGIPSSAHGGRLFPRHALATPGTPLNVLMLNAMRQYEGGGGGSGSPMTEEELESLRATMASGGEGAADAAALLYGSAAYETIAVLNSRTGGRLVGAVPRSSHGATGGGDGLEGSRQFLFSQSSELGSGRSGGGADLGMSPPAGMHRESSVTSSTNGTPTKPGGAAQGGRGGGNHHSHYATAAAHNSNRYGSAPPDSVSSTANCADGDGVEDGDEDSSRPTSKSAAVSRTNSRAAMRLSVASQLDTEYREGSVGNANGAGTGGGATTSGFKSTMEETMRQREAEREARRAQRRARAAKGVAGFEADEHGDDGGGEEEATPSAMAIDGDDGTATTRGPSLDGPSIAALRSPRTLQHDQSRAAMVRAEGEDREALRGEESLLWGRLSKDAEASAEEATIVYESRRRAELKRLAMHLATDDSKEREKRRIFEFVRDCIFDEEHARPEIVGLEAREWGRICTTFTDILRSDEFQCQVDERLNRLELFDLLEEEERLVLYEYYVEHGEKIGRRSIEAEWFEGVAEPFSRVQKAEERDKMELYEAVDRVEYEDEEAIDFSCLGAMFREEVIPIIERDSWKVVTAEADERLRIEREEPLQFVAIITNPEDDTPFEKSRVMVRWYTQTVNKARRDWLEHVTAKIKLCTDAELSGRLFVHQEQREDWILLTEMFKRDAELRMAEAQRREEFEARVAEAEAERRKEAEERLAKQGVTMPPPAASATPPSKTGAKSASKGPPSSSAAGKAKVGGGAKAPPAKPSSTGGPRRSPSAASTVAGAKRAPSPAPTTTTAASKRSPSKK